MVLERLKKSISVGFHMATVEFMTGLKTSFVCAPILILITFVNCELSQHLMGIHNLVYIVSIIMGVGVGVSAVSHTFTAKGEAMLYGALPMGRRRITALRLSVRLLAAAVTIFISCILVHLLGGNTVETAQLFSKEIENSDCNPRALILAARKEAAFSPENIAALLNS